MTKHPEEINIREILDLYNQNRYLDAHRLVGPLWDSPETIETLPVESIIHLGRLAGRLGGVQLRKRVFTFVLEKDPDNPLAKFVARKTIHRFRLLDELTVYEAEPEPGFENPAWSASWFAGMAWVFAYSRDFDKARELIQKARELNTGKAWVSCCEAETLYLEDRWEEALAAAEHAWGASPGMPGAAAVLGKVLARMGRIHDAVERLAAVADDVQSFETMLTIIWYMCAAAERSEETKQRALAERAYDLSGKLAALAPLADEETTPNLAAARVDIAMLLDDRERIGAHAEESDSPFYKTILENMKKHPRGKMKILPFRHVFQKHLTCLPASIAAVLGCFGITLDEDALAHDLTYNGTATWRVMDWLEERGWRVKPFLVTPSLVRSIIGEGLPFVYLTEYVNSAHASAAVGIDEKTDTLIIHDPSHERWGVVLIESINEYEAPFGPEALAVVPEERAAALDRIPSEACEPLLYYYKYLKTRALQGARTGAKVLHTLERAHPDHPYTKRLKAIHLGAMGRLYSAIEIQKGLLKESPECIVLQRELLDNLHKSRNTALLRKILEDIVKRGKMPGVRKHARWRRPPSVYVARWADLAGVTRTGFKEAEKALLKALEVDIVDAECFHILGDVYLRQGRMKACVLPFRCASLLEEHNEHYAREACNALARVGREREGLEFLKKRVLKLGKSPLGSHSWITLVDAYEEYGYPDLAIETMKRALAQWDMDAALHSHAVEFWIRMGEWALAQMALKTVKASGMRVLHLRAAVDYHQRSGEWQTALALCEKWVKEAPFSMAARSRYLHLHAMKEGRPAALSLSEKWMKRKPNDDEFEELHYDMLKKMFKREARETLILARIRRNADDVWAWREYGFILLESARIRSGEEREGLLKKFERVRETCVHLSPDDPVTLVLEADEREIRRDWEGALSQYFKALSRDPDYAYCYSRIWECSESFSANQQEQVAYRLERILLQTVGRLHGARDLAFKIANRFGAKKALDAVERWRAKRWDDPEIIEAKADLLLYYGQGRSDAKIAAELLEEELKRFPNHFDLRLSLAHAYSILHREEDEITMLREMVRRDPLNGGVRSSLASVLARRGEAGEAIEILNRGILCDPRNETVWKRLASVTWNSGRPAEAIDVLTRGVDTIPGSIPLRENLVERLHEIGDNRGAVEAARKGIERYPDGARLWQAYGEALLRSDAHTDVGEMETAFRNALARNAGLFEAADALAVLLTEQRRCEEARQIMKRQAPLLGEPFPALGRLAWIKRMEGNGGEALEEMVRILQKQPRYSWGWSQALEWLREDEQWERARDLLKTVHPVMLEDPDFQSRRLMLLGDAGAPQKELEEEWKRLLDDFPEHESLHNKRIDILFAEEKWWEAHELITALKRFHPNSPFVLAREVKALVERGKPLEAVECASRIWTAPGDEDTWPDESAWASLAGAGQEKTATARLYDIAKTGRRIRRRPFSIMVENLALIEKKKRFRFFGSETGARLAKLLEIAAGSDWDNGGYTAMILDKFIDMGDRRRVYSYVRENEDRCRESTPLWQTLGGIRRTGKQKDIRWTRNLMKDWRRRPGCEMWAVANYLMSLRASDVPFGSREDLDELHASSRDALEALPHDHTARYVVCVLCETTLRKKMEEAFVDHVNRFEAILMDDDEQWWMWPDYSWTPGFLLWFRDLVIEEDPEKVEFLFRKLKVYKSISHPWVQWTIFRGLKGKLPLWGRLKALLALWVT